MECELLLGTPVFFLDMSVEADARSKGFCTLVAIHQIVTSCGFFMSKCCVAEMMIKLNTKKLLFKQLIVGLTGQDVLDRQ